ncbi:MAG: hypothetical protein A2V79_01240 [Betaproteobacteria bacterium RBG_16_56_24]|nr:MAG: hypothetical protein A2V79_01240 [Betaproteobacteria bacterium RBG_16_56_24]
MNPIKEVITLSGILLAACLMFTGQAAYAGIAGHILFLNGNVQSTNSAGQTRVLQKGDAIHESDTVTTARGSSAQIKMRDGGYVVIRPDSQLKFDSFTFSGEEDGSEKSFFSMIRGGIRAITGLIGKKNKKNYRIETPGSTIGIRGTDHETVVVTAGSALAAVAPIGTYNKVNSGETTITTSKGTLPVLPNQMGFAGGADQMPQLQPLNLNIFTVVPPPSPQAQTPKSGGGKEVDVRAGAVVDNAVQGQDAIPENRVPVDIKLVPITNGGGGGTQPPVVF